MGRYRKVRLNKPKSVCGPKYDITQDFIVDDVSLECYYDKGWSFVCEIYDEVVCVHCGSTDSDGFWCNGCGKPASGGMIKDLTKKD